MASFQSDLKPADPPALANSNFSLRTKDLCRSMNNLLKIEKEKMIMKLINAISSSITVVSLYLYIYFQKIVIYTLTLRSRKLPILPNLTCSITGA